MSKVDILIVENSKDVRGPVDMPTTYSFSRDVRSLDALSRVVHILEVTEEAAQFLQRHLLVEEVIGS